MHTQEGLIDSHFIAHDSAGLQTNLQSLVFPSNQDRRSVFWRVIDQGSGDGRFHVPLNIALQRSGSQNGIVSSFRDEVDRVIVELQPKSSLLDPVTQILHKQRNNFSHFIANQWLKQCNIM